MGTAWEYRNHSKGEKMTDVVCKSCGYVGEPRVKTKGSIWIEVALWLCFIVPGLIYSYWRYASSSAQLNECPSCGQATMLIPADSPLGKKFINENLPEKTEITYKEVLHRPPSKAAQGIGRALGRVVGRLLR